MDILKESNICIVIKDKDELQEFYSLCDKSNVGKMDMSDDEKFPIYYFLWDHNKSLFAFYDIVPPKNHRIVTISEIYVKERKGA